MQGQNILEMRNIHKHFGGIKALNGVDLELRYQEILGLVGDNAAGKSTLMKIITGAYKPDEGDILFDGEHVHFHDPLVSRRVGIEMVYQDLALCRNLDVTSNLFLAREKTRSLFGGFVRVLNKGRMHREAAEILENLKIDVPSVRTKTGNLSGGQQQAVAIGRSTSFHPKLIILDEPTAALALKEVAKCLKLVEELRDQGISVILISHRLEDIFEIADRIMVLKNGERVGVWDASSLTPDEVVRYMFIGK
jgi:ABC-type sugar transport system ATPase subunit